MLERLVARLRDFPSENEQFLVRKTLRMWCQSRSSFVGTWEISSEHQLFGGLSGREENDVQKQIFTGSVSFLKGYCKADIEKPWKTTRFAICQQT